MLYDLDHLEIAIRLFAALGLGLLLGLEREIRSKPSGLRTHALVAEGAAVFMMTSLLLGKSMKDSGYDFYDPSRIASTVVQGVGFLIAGVMLAKGTRVTGLTSAADLWVTAAVGMAAGAGFLYLAALTTVATIVVMVVLKWLEQHIPREEAIRQQVIKNPRSRR